MPRYDKIPTYLNPEQRLALTQIPPDLSARDIARYYTFTQKELDLINRRRRPSNRLGFAVQLALLHFPGRTLMDVKEVPRAVLTAIADQIEVPASAFADYGARENTLYEHVDELRKECGFRSCRWREYLLIARSLLPDAMESDRALPLIETALEKLRSEKIIAPNMIHVERLVWIVLKLAERRLLRTLTASLSLEQRSRLDALLQADTALRGATRLSWLRKAPETPSPKSVKQIIERLSFLRTLELPPLPTSLHQNRVLQLARKCSKYQAQPLLNLESERRQEKHFRTNARTMNSHLSVLTKAAEAFLQARTEGEDPVQAVLTCVPEAQLQAVVASAKQLLRPEDLDSLDLIESRYTPMRQSLLALYQTLDFQPFRRSEPALQALEHVSLLAKSRRRVTAKEQRVGKVMSLNAGGSM